MYLIETLDLCQRYDERDILKNVNLKVGRGEVLALVGATGVGKTTLLRLIGLLDTPFSGRIYFDGIDVTESGTRRLETRRKTAFVLQKPTVFNTTVYDNVAYALKWRGVDKKETHTRVENTLEIIGLSSDKKRNARTLSGGEAQRVAIARAIITKPDLLILDEPLANLDPVSISKIEKLIANIVQNYETTVIMATHDMPQGQRLTNRVAILFDGDIVQTGVWREVFSSPQNREIAVFVGIENIIDGTIVSRVDEVVTIDIEGNNIEAISELSVAEEVSACIRAEEITLALSPVSTSARNSFAGRISHIATNGPFSQVELDCGFPLRVLVTKNSAKEMGLSNGKAVYARFKASCVHVIRKKNR